LEKKLLKVIVALHLNLGTINGKTKITKALEGLFPINIKIAKIFKDKAVANSGIKIGIAKNILNKNKVILRGNKGYQAINTNWRSNEII